MYLFHQISECFSLAQIFTFMDFTDLTSPQMCDTTMEFVVMKKIRKSSVSKAFSVVNCSLCSKHNAPKALGAVVGIGVPGYSMHLERKAL